MLSLEKIYDALLYWRGNMNASEFAEAVGRTRTHVQTEVIAPFLSDSSNKVLEHRGRKHGRTLAGRPKQSPGDLWSFFNLLAAERAYLRRERPGYTSLASIDIFDIAPPDPSGAAAWVCRATAQKSALVGNYLFKNHGVHAVNFSPHTMIRTPRRIHFRGHLLVTLPTETQDWGFVDLVPGRFLDDGQLALNGHGYRSSEADREWNTKVELTFQINPNLPTEAFLALQQEYDLPADEDGNCHIKFTTREALVYSFVHHVYDRTIGPKRLHAWIFRSSAISDVRDTL